MVATNEVFVPGDDYTSDIGNGMNDENKNLIVSVGLPSDIADNFETSKAVSVYSSRGDFYRESVGSASNTYLLEGVDLLEEVFELQDGMRFRFFVAAQNTGPSTVNINGLGVKNIFYDGLPIGNGFIIQGRENTIKYNLSLDRFNLEYVLDNKNLFVDPLTGNVGIGLTNPSSLGSNITTTEIKGMDTGRSGGVVLSSSDDSIKMNIYGATTDSATSPFLIGTSTNHGIRFNTNSIERLRITADGNVGIGAGRARFGIA